MDTAILRPGLGLLDGPGRLVRRVAQEIAHGTVHAGPGAVLWCDGDHGFNPYDFAELNLTRGFDADDGADRVLIKRCMTPFQWDSVLTKHLPAKLEDDDAAVVLALPFDRLFSTDELKDWEQADYVRFALKTLRRLAQRYRIPVLIGADVPRWHFTHPQLALWTLTAADYRVSVGRPDDAAVPLAANGNGPGRQTTIKEFERFEIEFESRRRWVGGRTTSARPRPGLPNGRPSPVARTEHCVPSHALTGALRLPSPRPPRAPALSKVPSSTRATPQPSSLVASQSRLVLWQPSMLTPRRPSKRRNASS